MEAETVGLKESIKMARIAKEQEIADVITSRKDLTYEQVGRLYGVSEWTIKQLVIKLHLTGLRKRGPTAKKQTVSRG